MRTVITIGTTQAELVVQNGDYYWECSDADIQQELMSFYREKLSLRYFPSPMRDIAFVCAKHFGGVVVSAPPVPKFDPEVVY